MTDTAQGFSSKPDVRPNDARFSSGPCRKHPGWTLSSFNTDQLGRSHRAKAPKARLAEAISRSADLLGLPEDWKLGIVPASDTGAFEMAMWSLLGNQPVDAFVWESFSKDWADDLSALGIEKLNVFEADYGALPDLQQANPDHDTVFVFNGTTSGVRVPNLDWIKASRSGLVLCDATSAAFSMDIDFKKVDVLTWSWQKVLGSEAAHGMLALSPRAVERLEAAAPDRPLPKIFRLTKKDKLIDGIFSGATINTPSMLALEDLHSALDWAEKEGGIAGLKDRTDKNFQALDAWVQKTDWIDWLAENPDTRSPTSMCLKIIDPVFTQLSIDDQQAHIKSITQELDKESVAFDIGNYRSAPPGFRIWGGATVDSDDITKLTPWLDWAYDRTRKTITTNNGAA